MSDRITGGRPHGNTKTGRPFHTTDVGGSFEVPPQDYTKANSARAHYQNSQWRKYKRTVKFSSTQVRDEEGRVKSYRFTREW